MSNKENYTEVVGMYITEKVSKNGNKYKCIIAVDENDKEHFVCFVH